MGFDLIQRLAGRVVLILIFVLAGNVSYGFQTSDDPFLSRLTAYNKIMENHHPEKIHIHTNQPFYHTGDTIWFKSYILNSFYNRPSVLNKVLHIELISSKGRIIYRTNLRSEAGLAWGNIPLTDTVGDGVYYLRAFTPGMKKFGKAFSYDRVIQIKSKSETPLSSVPARANSIQFFPEGGNLIAGIRTKVAFKALAPGGLGIEANGSIVDNHGQVVTEFMSEHLGMGVFAITMQPEKSYYAQVRFKDGTELKQLMPSAKRSGYSIAISSIGDSIRVRVMCSGELKGKGNLTLLASQDGINKYVSQFGVTQEIQNTIWVSKDLFNSGTVQFTLFDPESSPVSERLIFVNKQDELFISTDLKSSFLKRESVKFRLALKNGSGEPEIGNFSVSVYNESELATDDKDESSIFSDFLLTADLKGHIESPNYYFGDLKDDTRARHLDHLLLTQGWRTFSWKDVLRKNLPNITEKNEQGIALSGNMTLPSGKPFAGGEVSLFRAGLPPMAFQTRTDENGNFNFSDLDLTDNARLVISANNLNYRKNMKIKLFSDDSSKVSVGDNPYTARSIQAQSLPENARLNDMKANNSSILLDAVNIEGKKVRKVIESANLNGPGRADVVLTADDLVNQHDMSVFLTNRVTGLKLYDGKVYSRDIPDQTLTEGPRPMLIVLDGVTMYQENFEIGNLNADGIETVEVLKGAGTTGVYGIEGAYGVLVITTKKGRGRSGNPLSERTPGVLPITLTGYQSAREFYSPNYFFESSSAPGNADFRKAVYWNPNVSIGVTSKTEISYYNSDYVGIYKVVIEGINADGQLSRAVYRYETK